jgi:hypothetical protein
LVIPASLLLRKRNFAKLDFVGSPFELKALISREMCHEGCHPERKQLVKGLTKRSEKSRCQCSLPFGKARARPFITKLGERTSRRAVQTE